MRSRNEILADILRLLAIEDSRKTKICEKLSLHGSAATGYLDELMRKGYVARSYLTYRLTPMGKHASQTLEAARKVWA